MAHVKINPSNSRFLATFADGSPFGKHSYPTLGGVRKAISRAGHTYDKEDAPKATRKAKAAKSKSAPKTFEESTAAKLGYTREQCAQMYAWVVSQRKAGVTGDLSCEGHTTQGIWAAFRVGKAMHYSERSATKAKTEKPFAVFTGPDSIQTAQKRVEATLQKAVDKMEIIRNAQDPRWTPKANESAVELGFPSYKALKNAHKKAAGNERENLLGLRNICIRTANRAAA